MKRNYYIFSPGHLKRKDNTIFFEPFFNQDQAPEKYPETSDLLTADADLPDTETGNKKVLPVQDIEAFYIMANVTFNYKFMDFVSKNNIPVHFFNYYGFYNGSYYPREYLNSGFLIVRQSEYYLDHKKRMPLARKFVEGAAFNILKNLKYYNKRDRDLQAQIDTIDSILPDIDTSEDIPTLMNVEGQIRKIYYTAFNDILSSEIKFTKREFYPPTNPLNALISFCNSMVYTTALSELYRTQLNPTVSYLHEPGVKRFSLALDLAEIFKPLLADRIIFKLLNTQSLKEKDFEKKLKGHYLKEKGRKKIVQEYDSKLKTTIKHRILNREVSYRRLVRLECYKLVKHLSGDRDFEPFKIWW